MLFHQPTPGTGAQGAETEPFAQGSSNAVGEPTLNEEFKFSSAAFSRLFSTPRLWLEEGQPKTV